MCIAIFLGACSESTAASNTQVLELEVKGMTCGHCAQGVKTVLKQKPEIKNLFISVEDSLVAVEWDSQIPLDSEALKSWISESGFDLGKVETKKQNFEDWKQNFLKSKDQES